MAETAAAAATAHDASVKSVAELAAEAGLSLGDLEAYVQAERQRALAEFPADEVRRLEAKVEKLTAHLADAKAALAAARKRAR